MSETKPPFGARVVALVPEPARVARLRAAFGDECRVVASPPHLIAVAREARVELVVISPLDNEKRSLETPVAAIRASRRSPPTYVYTDRSAGEVRELMPLARAGARGVIVVGADDDPVQLRKLLEARTVHAAIESVIGAVHDVVNPRYAPLVLHALEHIDGPMSAERFARALHVSRRTLTAWAQAAGARGVRSLITRCRVMVAIEMLRAPLRSIEETALALHFASSAHLHNTVRRYTHLRPRECTARSTADWCRALIPGTRSHRLPPAKMRSPPAEWSNMPNVPILHPRQAQPGEQ